eukprot:SAG31_NODE_367_length_16811_cov_20.811584_3_plen_269_part_00
MTLLEQSSGHEADQAWFKSMLDGFVDPGSEPSPDSFGPDPGRLAENLAAQMSKSMFSEDTMKRSAVQSRPASSSGTTAVIGAVDSEFYGSGAMDARDRATAASGRTDSSAKSAAQVASSATSTSVDDVLAASSSTSEAVDAALASADRRAGEAVSAAAVAAATATLPRRPSGRPEKPLPKDCNAQQKRRILRNRAAAERTRLGRLGKIVALETENANLKQQLAESAAESGEKLRRENELLTAELQLMKERVATLTKLLRKTVPMGRAS